LLCRRQGLGQAFADQRHVFHLAAVSRQALLQAFAALAEAVQPTCELTPTFGLAARALAQGQQLGLRGQPGIQRAQALAELAQAGAELLCALSHLLRATLQPRRRLATFFELLGQLLGAFAGFLAAGQKLVAAAVQFGQSTAQAVQVALRAGGRCQNQLPACFAEHGVHTLAEFGREAARKAGAGVVVALAGGDQQLGRAGLGARHGALAEVHRHLQHEGQAPCAQLGLRGLAAAVAAPGKAAFGLDGRQQVAPQV
jgi:hypothetical protein